MTEGSDSELDPEDVTDVLRVIELYEDDEVCDSPIIVVEIGLDRATVDRSWNISGGRIGSSAGS